MKKISCLTAVLFLLAVFGLSICFFLLPDRPFSDQENRSLQLSPHFSWKKLKSGAYMAETDRWFADQFPGRDLWVGCKGVLELLSGKGENNGILLGRNGQLAKDRFDIRMANGGVIADSDGFDPAHVANCCRGINSAAEHLQIPFSVLLTGRNIDIAASAFDLPPDHSQALLAAVREGIAEDVTVVETVELLRDRFAAGEAVYYRTDHHWSTRGAYYAYAETMRAFGRGAEILPMSAFEHRTVTDRFYGTLWSAGGMKWVEPDAVELWLMGDEDEYEVIADGKPTEGLYSMSWLAKKDCYSVFLDGTHDVVTVRRASGEPRPRLLLIKDSFANSLAPFLARHFDLVLLNLSSTRTDFTNVTEQAEKYAADAVLLVYTLENLITADKLPQLR